jgi:cytochrome c biogenesis protein CcmG/thiol:disulfide interchange protein DsbE
MSETTLSQPKQKSRLHLGWVLALVGVVALLAVIGVILSRTEVKIGDIAPDFTVTAFNDTPLGGSVFRLSQARGVVVLVNFWASWCAPCRDEAPALEKLWQTYQNRGFILVGVAWTDTEAESLKFIREFNQTYLNGPDLGTRAGTAFRIRGVPETYLIDREGRLVWLKKGPITFDELQAVIEPLLMK